MKLINASEVPIVSTDQMREIDYIMIDELGISLLQMMENAGRNLARLACELFLGNHPEKKKIVIFAGSGGNGGGGMVCARFLHNWGANVHLMVTKEKSLLKEVPKKQLEILNNMGIKHSEKLSIANDFKKPDLIIDSIIGYSLIGNPKGQAAVFIEWINSNNIPVLSLDVPSGLDTANGTVSKPTIKADATMTLALPKIGLTLEKNRNVVGDLYLADISVSPRIYKRITGKLEVKTLFSEGEIIKLMY